jgi:hypothetical protein
MQMGQRGGTLNLYIENILFNFEKPPEFKYFLGDGPIKMTHCKKKKKLEKHPHLINSKMK